MLKKVHLMSFGQLVELKQPELVTITRYEPQGPGKGAIEMTNVTSQMQESNVAFKVKTTATSLYTVNPISGIIKPGAEDSVLVRLLVTFPATRDEDAKKNKFMVQAAMTDLQPGADTKQFW